MVRLPGPHESTCLVLVEFGHEPSNQNSCNKSASELRGNEPGSIGSPNARVRGKHVRQAVTNCHFPSTVRYCVREIRFVRLLSTYCPTV
jgi:hypothetical protein